MRIGRVNFKWSRDKTCILFTPAIGFDWDEPIYHFGAAWLQWFFTIEIWKSKHWKIINAKEAP